MRCCDCELFFIIKVFNNDSRYKNISIINTLTTLMLLNYVCRTGVSKLTYTTENIIKKKSRHSIRPPMPSKQNQLFSSLSPLFIFHVAVCFSPFYAFVVFSDWLGFGFPSIFSFVLFPLFSLFLFFTHFYALHVVFFLLFFFLLG